MRFSLKSPPAFDPNKLFGERAKLREQAIAVESERLSKVETLKTDPLEFFRQVQEHMLTTTLVLETL
jgi:hypothetical protein